MAKTELTIQLEREIYGATAKQGVFGCFEVTIGWFGNERVDYMTYDTKGIFRCYEIKISKSDFNSKAHNTFLGQFNYYVLTKDLYEQVKDIIPIDIGVYVNGWCVKKAKRRSLGEDEQVLKNSLIRSLTRCVDKQIKSGNPTLIEQSTRISNQYKKDMENYRHKYWELRSEVENKYGSRWNKTEMGGGQLDKP